MHAKALPFENRVQGEGKPFLWAHGLLTCMEAEDCLDWFQWRKFPPSVRLIRYNARGHGRSLASCRAEDYRWQNLATDMLSLADHLGIDRFIAGGASMGACTALFAALQSPERIDGLVLVSPPTAWQTRIKQASQYRRSAWLALLFGGKGLAALAAREGQSSLPTWMDVSRSETMRQTFALWHRYSRKTLWAIFHGAARSNLPPKPVFRKLADKAALIIAWPEDTVHPLETAEELHHLLPRSELFIANNEQQFNQIPARMIDFIQKVGTEQGQHTRNGCRSVQ